MAQKTQISISNERPAGEQRQPVVVIAANPKSGGSNQEAIVEELAAQLKIAGFEVRRSGEIDQVKAWVSQLSTETAALQNSAGDAEGRQLMLRAVVAAGGDGTVSLLANELPPGTPLVILPLGTENLLAKHLGLKPVPAQICQTIAANQTICIDVGRANGKLFLVMASCGFDADVVQRLHAARKGHINYWSYAKPIWSSIGQYRYPLLQLFLDGSEQPLLGRWAFIFNVPRYAMNLPIITDADPEDGRLDLCAFRGGSLFRGLFYLGAVFFGQHRRWTNAHLQTFQRLRIEADGRVPFQLDGDPGGELPVEIEVVPKFLRLLVPSSQQTVG